ncbi:MAG TPA: arabinan endo-1,5-alpha-L-arabinosidase [Candidatus Didemnitutus sp.]|nr:arabinan endo-1,5-alpha-L-arabinosidase [Candidatus Didemnitutus sp.]
MKFVGCSAWAFGTVFVATLLAPRVPAAQVIVHDPVMTREGDTTYVFSTGPGIPFYSSKDMKTWKSAGRVFATEPTWAKTVAPGFDGQIWAPEIVHHDGQFFLYYAVSAFGKNTSAIGVTVNQTLDPGSPHYHWQDRGIVVQSVPGRDLWNAIDPAVQFDDDGSAWLAFGSFWSGIKLTKLAPSLTSLAHPEEWYGIAKRERSVLEPDQKAGPAEIEAPFLFRKNGYYYLFTSWGLCCRGQDSTYRIVIGRSKDIRGPYVDKDGKNLAEGGGSLVLAGGKAWPGLGHNGAYTFDGKDYLIFHAYEMADHGLPKLKILEMKWDDALWPVVDPKDVESYTSVLQP